MQKNSFERFVNRWMRSIIKDLEAVLKDQLIKQNCSIAKIKTGLATLTIQEQAGKSDQHFAATWTYHCGKESVTIMRIEWAGNGFRIFTNPPKTRKERREEARGKIIEMPEQKLITDANLDDMDVEIRAKSYLDAEKKKPSTTTHKLRDRD